MKLQATGENSQSRCLYRTIVKFCYYHCLKNLLSLSPYLFPTFNISSMRHFARFGTILGVLVLVKMQPNDACNSAKSNIPPLVFLTFLKL